MYSILSMIVLLRILLRSIKRSIRSWAITTRPQETLKRVENNGRTRNRCIQFCKRLQDNEKDALVTLESIEPGSGDSIYDLIFSEYDEENKE